MIGVCDAVQALREHGEMTAAALAALFNVSRREAARAIHGARRGKVKRIYIKRWTRQSDEGLRPYLRPVYAAGGKADAPKPRAWTDAYVARRYKQKLRERRTVPVGLVNSIFALGAHLCSSN